MRDLATAFAATTYRVDAGVRRFELRVGARHADFDAYLEALARAEGRAAPTGWAIVTAANPGAVRADDEANAARQAALHDRVRQAGWRFLAGANVADDGLWPDEPSLLVIDAGEAAVRALAADFAQAAIVCGNIADKARLVWLKSPQRASYTR